jgi:uncharacterized protein (TIGR00297 family)
MVVAIAVASAVAIVAWRVRLLTASGGVAAAAVGAAVFAAGLEWVSLLLAFFVSANALSAWRAIERDRLTSAVVDKGGRRDAAQVLANGAVFAVAAVLVVAGGDAVALQAVASGAIATAMADTWSTEVGTVAGGTPRMFPGGGRVPPGTSGAVSVAGTAAGVLGAVLAALVALVVDWTTPFAVIVVAGVTGSFVDTLLGATVQERRWCPTCDHATERHEHLCGTLTLSRGGMQGWNNDVVNFTSTIAGAAVSWALA